MKPFRWAYIGSGKIADRTARSITKGAHTITAVYSRNAETAKAFAKKYGAKVFQSVDEMLAADCFDGVYIATPHTSHQEYAVKAMRAGRPVLCEKPAGVNEVQVDLMLRAAQENRVYFCEAMWTWFSDVALTVKKWIAENRIGEIKNVRMRYAIPGLIMSKSSRLLDPATAGGALLDIGIYPIAYCCRLFGNPQTILCVGRLGNGIDTKETVVLGYKGFSCTIEISFYGLWADCVILGADGKISVPVFYKADRAILKTKGRKEKYRGRTDYLTEFTRVAEEIKQGRTESVFVPYAATKSCVRVLDECRRQLRLVYPFEQRTKQPEQT